MDAAAIEQQQQQQQQEPQEWLLAASKRDLDNERLLRVELKGRMILLVSYKGGYYALDNLCYHSGGPLDQGRLTEIEDLQKRPCVVCPWHSYQIMLDTGEGIYRSVDPFTRPRTEVVKSKGHKQRTHPIKVEDGQVYVQVNLGGNKLESDYYSSEEFRALMARGHHTVKKVSLSSTSQIK